MVDPKKHLARAALVALTALALVGCGPTTITVHPNGTTVQRTPDDPAGPNAQGGR